MKKHILLFGNYGGHNWGDEAICQGLLSTLSNSGYIVDVVSANPRFTSTAYHVFSISRPPAGVRSLLTIRRSVAFFKTLKRADIVIFGGGGLFQDKERFAVLLWWYYVSIVRLFGKKIIFVANSVGPLSTIVTRWLTKQALSRARFISVRDQDSKILLKQLGVQSERVILASDAVFLLKKSPAASSRQGTLIMIRGDQPLIVDRIKKLIKANQLPTPIKVIAMDTMDKNIIQEIGVPIIIPKNITELRKKIASSHLILSSRLHGCLLSILEETPFIAFSSAPKITAFLRDRKLQDIIFPEKFSYKKIVHKIHEITDNQLFAAKLRDIRIQEKKTVKNALPIFLQ